MTPALSIQHLAKSFGAHSVLDGVDLQIESTELFGFLGVNGAGKTTLMKTVLDLSAPSVGNIEIFGLAHRDRSARAKLIYLPEQFTPPYFMTGYEFLAYSGRLSGTSFGRDAMAALADSLELDIAALGQPVKKYSQGMTRKLGLAACLSSARPLLVLDEPMSGLDPKARALFKTSLRGLKSQGRTVFFSSHDLAEIEQLCDRIAILHAGKIRFSGSPAQCLTTYNAESLEAAFLQAIIL